MSLTTYAYEDDGLLAMFDELLEYRPFTGSLLWRRRRSEQFAGTIAKPADVLARAFNARYAGNKAGSIAQQRFCVISHRGFHYRADRIAFALYHGAWPVGRLLHANGDYADDRIANLVDDGAIDERPVTRPAPRPAGPWSLPALLASSAWCRAWGNLNGRTVMPFGERRPSCLPTGAIEDGQGRWLLPSTTGTGSMAPRGQGTGSVAVQQRGATR